MAKTHGNNALLGGVVRRTRGGSDLGGEPAYDSVFEPILRETCTAGKRGWVGICDRRTMLYGGGGMLSPMSCVAMCCQGVSLSERVSDNIESSD